MVEGGLNAVKRASQTRTPEQLALAKLDAGEKMSKADNVAAGLYHPYGANKLLVPYSRMTSKVVDDPKVVLHKGSIITPEQAVKERMGFFPLIGDRAETGKILTEVNNRPLKKGVPLTGGRRYMEANYDPDMKKSAAWESGKGKTTSLGNQIQAIDESGYQPVGVFSPGSHTQVDFNTMMPNALINQFDKSATTPTLMKAFDNEVRSVYPDWVGIDHPLASSQLEDKANGVLRTVFTQTMDKKLYQNGGFPDVPSTRKAISDPELHDVEIGTIGLNAAKFDPERGFVAQPKHPSSYPLAMTGQNMGAFDRTNKYSDFFSTANEARRLLGADKARDYRSFELAQPIQYANQEWLDKLYKARLLEDQAIKQGGYKKGGEVKKAEDFDAKVDKLIESHHFDSRLHDMIEKHMAGGAIKKKNPPATQAKLIRLKNGGSTIPFTEIQKMGRGGVPAQLGKDRPAYEAITQGLAPMLYGAAKGTLAGVAGGAGDLEEMGRAGVRYFGRKMGKPNLVEEEAVLPTSDDVMKRLPSLKDYGAGKDAQHSEEIAGKLGANGLSLIVSPSVAKLTNKAVKETGKALAPKAGDMIRDQMMKHKLLMPIVAYHGSPHRMAPTKKNPLGQFDESKIGTGEGAQSYGEGHYLAQVPDTSKYYIPRDFDHEERLMNMYKRAESKKDYEAMEVLESAMMHRTPSELLKQYPQNKQLIEQIEAIPKKGHLYHVDLPDEHIANMINYDKAINEQTPEVKALLEKAGINIESSAQAGPMVGGQERTLAKHGIPGLKYYDEKSRHLANWEVGKSGKGTWLLKNNELSPNQYKEFPTEEEAVAAYNAMPDTGTRNFVVFPGNEDMLNIIKREKKGGLIKPHAQGGKAFKQHIILRKSKVNQQAR